MLSGSLGSPDMWVARSIRVIDPESLFVISGMYLLILSSTSTIFWRCKLERRMAVNTFEIEPISYR